MLYVGAHRYVHEIQTCEKEKSIEREKKRLRSNNNIVSSLKMYFRISILAEIFGLGRESNWVAKVPLELRPERQDASKAMYRRNSRKHRFIVIHVDKNREDISCRPQPRTSGTQYLDTLQPQRRQAVDLSHEQAGRSIGHVTAR